MYLGDYTYAEKVLDRTVWVVVTCAKSAEDLLAIETHLDHVIHGRLKLFTSEERALVERLAGRRGGSRCCGSGFGSCRC